MRKIFIVLILLALTQLTIAGSSIFGLAPKSLGTINYNHSTAAMGRGGFEMAYPDTLSLNNLNYAQWPFLTQTTINMNMAYNRLSTEITSQTTTSYSGNFTGAHLAIPIKEKKWAIGIGLLPTFSNDQKIMEYNNEPGSYDSKSFKTTGNMSEASFIGSYAITEDISVAAAISYNFGLIEDEVLFDFQTTSNNDVGWTDKTKVYGSSFALHSFYKINPSLYSGLKVRFPAELKLKKERDLGATGTSTEIRGTINLPMKIAFGMAYLFNNQYITGIDLDYQSWKDGYKIDGLKQEAFENSYRVSVGFEIMPGERRFIPYYQKMYYRAGFYLGQLNIKSNDNSIFEYGFGLGLGLPILSPKDRIDFAIQYGKRGDLSKNLATENIFKINISITAGSLWFVREEN